MDGPWYYHQPSQGGDFSIHTMVGYRAGAYSTSIGAGSLHLYEPLAPFMNAGDVIGHEPMGIVEEVGPGVRDLEVGDRVVVPFNVCCGSC